MKTFLLASMVMMLSACAITTKNTSTTIVDTISEEDAQRMKTEAVAKKYNLEKCLEEECDPGCE